MPKASDKVLTGLAGEFYVAAELCRRGYLASLTLKNYPKVDIFALDPATQHQITLQVKTVRGKSSWAFFVPEDADKYSGYFIFVVLASPPAPPYLVHILTGIEVAELSAKARADFIASHLGVNPVQPLMLGPKELALFEDNWDRLLPS